MPRHRLLAVASAALLAVPLTACGDDGADVRQLEGEDGGTGTATGSGTGTGTGTGGETGTGTEGDTDTEADTETEGDTEGDT